MYFLLLLLFSDYLSLCCLSFPGLCITFSLSLSLSIFLSLAGNLCDVEWAATGLQKEELHTRSLEREESRYQERAQADFLSLVSLCISPAPLLRRLRWERALTDEREKKERDVKRKEEEKGGEKKLKAIVEDTADGKKYLLQTLVCVNEREADFVEKVRTSLLHLSSPSSALRELSLSLSLCRLLSLSLSTLSFPVVPFTLSLLCLYPFSLSLSLLLSLSLSFAFSLSPRSFPQVSSNFACDTLFPLIY